MANEYKLLKRLADDLVVIYSPRYGEQLWSKGICRKHKICVISGKDLYRKEAYLPITNGGNRMERIEAGIIDNIE